jgi:hypothetical protein
MDVMMVLNMEMERQFVVVVKLGELDRTAQRPALHGSTICSRIMIPRNLHLHQVA